LPANDVHTQFDGGGGCSRRAPEVVEIVAMIKRDGSTRKFRKCRLGIVFFLVFVVRKTRPHIPQLLVPGGGFAFAVVGGQISPNALLVLS